MGLAQVDKGFKKTVQVKIRGKIKNRFRERKLVLILKIFLIILLQNIEKRISTIYQLKKLLECFEQLLWNIFKNVISIRFELSFWFSFEWVFDIK